MQSQPRYSFPLLHTREILSCMRDLGIPCTEDDIVNPSSEKVLFLYDTFSEYFMGVKRANFAQPSLKVLDYLEFPELQMDAISTLGFCMHLQKNLMSKIGVENFSIRDVIKPEHQRLRRNLSAIINFAKFREDRMVLFEDCTVKSNELEENRKAVEFRRRELEARFNALRVQRAEQEPAIQKASDICTSLTNDLRELKRLNTQLTSDIESLKKEKNDLQEQATLMNSTIASLKEESLRLQSRIVENPEKLRQRIHEMGVNLQNEKNNIVALEKKLRDSQAKLDMLDNIEQDLAPCLGSMKECEDEMRRRDENLKKVQEDKERIDRKNSVLRDLGMKETQLKRQLTSASEKITRLQRHQAMRREAIGVRLQNLRAEYAAINEERLRIQQQIEDNRRTAEEMEDRIASLKQHMEMETASVEQDYAQLKAEVSRYQSTLSQSFTQAITQLSF